MAKSSLKPEDTIGKYTLNSLVGSGAAGEVWLALEEGEHGFRKQVALKILTRSRKKEAADALMKEANLCAAMKHPNVIDVYGAGRDEQRAWIVMEFVEGETLSALWRDLEFVGVRCPRAVICDIGIAVCEALHHAWTVKGPDGEPLKIVHRDLKPANVMISSRGEVKVADFGIAKAQALETNTIQGRLKGTPSYLAPEMWERKHDWGPTIDLWAVGVMLWEMATGRRFLGGAPMHEIYDLLMARQPLDEAEQVGDWFPELVPILARLLQRDPEVRPQTGFEVAEALRKVRFGMGPAGDLMQFIRLVRAGRLEPDERTSSLVSLPALPDGLPDWEPLVRVAAGEDSGEFPFSKPADDLLDDKKVKLGPTGEHERVSPDSGTKPVLAEDSFVGDLRAALADRSGDRIPPPIPTPVPTQSRDDIKAAPLVPVAPSDSGVESARMRQELDEPMGREQPIAVFLVLIALALGVAGWVLWQVLVG